MMNYTVAGLMSGTSLDGIDIAVVNFNTKNWNFKVIHSFTTPYDKKLKEKIRNILNTNILEAFETDKAIAEAFANAFLKIPKPLFDKIDLFVSSGHTVIHLPEKKLNWQIGKGAIIAAIIKKPLVYDIRSLDIALGGQGAPLVPFGEYHLFKDFNAFLNLGGFANFTFFKRPNKGIAADLTFCNFALNYFAQKLRQDFDKNGVLGQKGKIIPELLSELNNLEIYKTNLNITDLNNPLKIKLLSLSDHWFYNKVLPIINSYKSESIYNILRTIYEHIAEIISKKINKFNPDKIMITGGGAYNKFLISLLKDKLNSEIYLPDNQIIDFKEAIIFAFLGLRVFLKKTNVFSALTGADFDSISGSLIYPKP